MSSTPAIKIRPTVPQHVYDPTKDDLIELKGDPHDPGAEGISSTHRLNNAAEAKVLLLYQHPFMGDLVVEAEVYVDPGNRDITVHMLCPECRNSLTVPSTKKVIDWEPGLGLISVEQSTCTWEEKRDQHVDKGQANILLRKNLCSFSFVVDRNVIRKV